MLYIGFDEVREKLLSVLLGLGFAESDAAYLADAFAENTLDGVYSHGVNRFPRFVQSVRAGYVDVRARAKRVAALGGMEVWDGHFCAGPLGARDAMARAVELAKAHGIACVSLRNGNHWQRAGRYGLQAAKAGMIGCCFTNTAQNMPAWGAADARIGNNPLVVAVPRKKGVVLVDMSMSQYAYGKMEVAALAGKQMPTDAGYDENGQLTRDPSRVIKTGRTLPMGYWKGSSLSLVMDMIAAGTSLGMTCARIGPQSAGEKGLSQVFIAVNYSALVDESEAQARFDEAVDETLASRAAGESATVRYPGQTLESTRRVNMERGLPINEATWESIQGM